MRPARDIDSLVIFGSVSRGDSDRYSDRDLLVVADRQHEYIDSSFVKAGYSPSFYTWQQLEGLARDGSLFLQHLKQESTVLRDRAGRLHELLDRFRPWKDYSAKLQENRRLFEMTRGVPAYAPALSWAFDVLAVAFRNHAILHLAQRGVYIFSYSALVSEFASEFGLSSAEVSLLKELRIRKQEYRTHPRSVEVSLLALQRTQALLEKIVQVKCLSTCLSSHEFIERLLSMPIKDLHWYYALRCYEGVYRTLGFMPTHDGGPACARLEDIFANPSPYKSAGADCMASLRMEIWRLAMANLAPSNKLPTIQAVKF